MSSLSAYSTAGDMLRALRSRAVSALELCDLHIARIERLNPALRAIVTPNFEAAREWAQEVDRRGAAGTGLNGLPLTIKDCIDTEALPTTGGLIERADEIALEDAPPVARLRQSGAVILGKTNVPPYASDWQADNPLFGRSANPWDVDRTPGGSTGGGAAAVAAGLSPIELGGDFVGSIRIPAAFCGLYGHKPSLSLVPGTGHFPISAVPNRAARMAVLGPLARSAGDLDLILNVIAGPETDERAAWHVKLPSEDRPSLCDFRVAVLQVPDWMPVDTEITAAVERIVGYLDTSGAAVQYVPDPELGDLHRYFSLYMAMTAAMSSARTGEEDRRTEAERRRSTGDPFDAAWATGLLASAQDYVLMEAQREAYRLRFRAFFEQFDVLLTPVNLVNAFPHRDDPYLARRLDVAGASVPYEYQSFFAGLANLSGHPATAFPAGRTEKGLPIGLQVVGAYLRDRTCIRFCAALEADDGGFRPPPDFPAEPESMGH